MNMSRLLLFITFFSFVAETAMAGRSSRRYRRAATAFVNTELENNQEAIEQTEAASSASSVNDSFSDSAAASDSDLTGTLSMLAGVASIAYAVSQIPPCVTPGGQAACAQVALGLAQAGSMFGQGGSAFGTRDNLSDIDFDWGNPDLESLIGDIDDGGTGTLESLIDAGTTGNTEDYLNTVALANDAINQGIATLEKNGMTFNKETGEVFDKNGNKINGTGSVPKSLTNKLNAAADRVKKDHAKRSNTLSAKAGGGSTVVFEDPFGSDSNGRAPESDKKKEKKSDFLAGLSDGSNGGVGVEGDDIFKMMTRRYTKKIKSKEFIFK